MSPPGRNSSATRRPTTEPEGVTRSVRELQRAVGGFGASAYPPLGKGELECGRNLISWQVAAHPGKQASTPMLAER